MDVSDPTRPVSVGTAVIGTTPEQVRVQGKYAYVTSTVGLQVLDVSTNTPSIIAQFAMASGAEGIDVQGRYAYVSESSSGEGLYIIDISNPYAPAVVQFVKNPLDTYANYVRVQGRYAYVTSISNGRVLVFDVGGAYISALEAGNVEVSSLDVRKNAIIANDLNVAGGLVVGRSIAVHGPFSVSMSDAFATSTAFVVNPAGNVGVGTTSPYTKLAVVGELAARNFTATSTTATSTFYGVISGPDATFGDLRIRGATTTSRILIGGTNFNTVYIGTTTPTMAPLYGLNIATSTYIHGSTTVPELTISNVLGDMGSSTPRANTLYKENIIKAWIQLNGSGTITVRDSFNVSSIVDDATGTWTINWTTAFANKHYAVVCTVERGSLVNRVCSPGNQEFGQGTVQIFVESTGGANQDAEYITLIAVGDQ